MRPLPTTFSKDGYDYTMLRREGDVAMYRQEGGGLVLPRYEVVIVQRYSERTIAGKVIPASESIPPTSAWGKLGWTLVTLQEADAKLKALVAKEASCYPPLHTP